MTDSSVKVIKLRDGQKFIKKSASKPASSLFLRITIRQSFAEMFREFVMLWNSSAVLILQSTFRLQSVPNHTQTGSCVSNTKT